MSHFEYKVSVIVPVYNVEKYLRDCLDSLLAQTIDHDEMEVLLINDGSTDGSLGICEEYAELFECFKVFSQENAGVSAARNLGIGNARGKYIMYLDSDDMLTPETVKSVTDFFDTVYGEVDLVTYKIQPYKNGIKGTPHFRYNYLKESGIYDLNEFPYITQTSMNIVVKNIPYSNFFFDTSLSQGEDQKYATEFLLDKMKLGYCDKGEYKYIIHDGSAVKNEAYSFYLFEQRTGMWEELFDRFAIVPKYIQGLVLANYQWELTSDCIFPYHYKGEAYENAIGRIKNILLKIDVETIINHPSMDMFHKHFWISMKSNAHPTVIFKKDEMLVTVNGSTIYRRDNMEIVLNKVDIRNNTANVRGFIKSPIFNYINDIPALKGIVGKKQYEISLFDSINSCYKTTARTNNFFGFDFTFMCSGNDELYFTVTVDGIEYETQFYCVPSAVFHKTLEINSFVRNGYLISLHNNILKFEKCSEQKKCSLEADRKFPNASSEVYQIRKLVTGSGGNERIWLYSDHASIGADNAFYQFQHDWGKNDGVLRYYICDGNRERIIGLFTDKQSRYLVEYGSRIHKILYLRAEYIITSYMDIRPKQPFQSDAEFAYYRDLSQPVTICLQHGVLHADLRWLQSAERCRADKVVISSFLEKENYVNKYHYREEDLIETGMPRYDHIDKNASARNRILFAPSWRSYLLKKDSSGAWEKTSGQLIKSNYFKKFFEFLSSPKLADILGKNDLYLDAKLHQNMKSALEFFEIDSERINITTQHVKVEDYRIFITDISSYVFDYAYLNRPVVYFMPDMEEFESGMNHYRKLDLPWEKAFGNLTTTPEGAVNEIIRIIRNNFVPDAVFRERMDNFYLALDNCSEKLYAYLANEEK